MENKEKHCLLTLEYPPNCGGVGIYLYNLLENSKSYDFKALKHIEQNSCSVKSNVACSPFFYKFFWPHWLKIYFFLKKYHTKWAFKVLHISHLLPLGYIAYFLAKKLNFKYVIYLHGLDFNLMKNSVWKAYWGRKILHRAAVVITNSKFLQKELMAFMGADFNKSEVIYPMPNHNLLQLAEKNESASDLEQLSQIYNLQKNDKVLLTVGRLVERKGQALVLQALKYLPDYKYFILGRGPEKENLENLIKNYNLENRVYLLPDILGDRDLANYYRLADLFVMPSLELGNDVEGFGIVYLEANAFALPVVAGQGEGVREAVADNKTGLILQKARDIDEIVMKIQKIMEDKDFYQKLSVAALKHYKQYVYEEDYLFKKINKYL